MTYYVLKIPAKFPENKMEVHSFDRQEKTLHYVDFCFLKTLCGADYEYWETVTINLGGLRPIMLVEESGKYKDLPVNPLASALYGNPFDTINGDVFLCLFDGKEDLDFLDEVDLGMIKAGLWKTFNIDFGQYVLKEQDPPAPADAEH